MSDPKGKIKIQLIPWDLKSAHHRGRMLQQRVACGFGTESVEIWMKAGVAGTTAMYWITLADDCFNRNEFLEAHIQKYPEDSVPLLDTASTVFLHQRTPTNAQFNPVGHIGLALRPEQNCQLGLPSDASIVWLIGVYVSWVLHGCGIGIKAMNAAESIATDKRGLLQAELMILDSIPESFQFSDAYKESFYSSRGLQPPQISLEKWYERQGFVKINSDPTSVPWKNGDKIFQVPLWYYKKKL